MHCSQDRTLLTVQFAQHRLLPVRSPSRNLPSCFPTLPSIHPAADVLAMSCSCKSGSKSGGDPPNGPPPAEKCCDNTSRKRRPDELPHFFERFPNWHPIREARKFPCHIPTMAQTTIQPRALAEWRTNFNCLPASFERQKEKNRIRPRLLFFFRHAWLWSPNVRVHTRNHNNHYKLAWIRR